MGPQEDDPRASEASAAKKKQHRCWSSILMWAACTTLCAQLTGVGGLKNVRVVSPGAVAVGETAALECQYDLEGAELYAVKWYKGKKEFYRYLPKEDPPTKVFPLPGINVDLSESDAHHVVLRDAGFTLTGRYRCEVSADAPSFDTALVVASLVIVEDEGGDGVEDIDIGEEGEEEEEIEEDEGDEDWDEQEDEDNDEWAVEGEEEEQTRDHEEEDKVSDGEKFAGNYGRRNVGIVPGSVSYEVGEGRLRYVERLEVDGDERVSEEGHWGYDGKSEDAQCELKSAEGGDCEVGRTGLGVTEEWEGEYGNRELSEVEEISRSAWQSVPRGCDDTEADPLGNMGGKQAKWLGCDGVGGWDDEGEEDEELGSWIEEDEEFDEGIWALNSSLGCEAGRENRLEMSETSPGVGECHFGNQGVEEGDAIEEDFEGIYRSKDDNLGDRAVKRLNMDQLILNVLEGLSKVIDGVLEVIVRLIEEGRYLEEEELDEDVERDLESRIFRMREENPSPFKKKKGGNEKEKEERERVLDGGRLTKFIEGIRSYGQRELKVEGNDVVNYKAEGRLYELNVGNQGAMDFNEEGEEREDGTEGEDFFRPEEDLEGELMSFLPGVANDGAKGGGSMLEGDIPARGPRIVAEEAVRREVGAGVECGKGRDEGAAPIVWTGMRGEMGGGPCRALRRAGEGAEDEDGGGAGSFADGGEGLAGEDTPSEDAQFFGDDQEYSREREDEVQEGVEDARSPGVCGAAAGKPYDEGKANEERTEKVAAIVRVDYLQEEKVEMVEEDGEEIEAGDWKTNADKSDINEWESKDVVHHGDIKLHYDLMKEIMKEKDLVNEDPQYVVLKRDLTEINDMDCLDGEERECLEEEKNNEEDIGCVHWRENVNKHEDCTSDETYYEEPEEQDELGGYGAWNHDDGEEENAYDFEETISDIGIGEYGRRDGKYGDGITTWDAEKVDLDIELHRQREQRMNQEKGSELKSDDNGIMECAKVENNGEINQETEDEDFVNQGDQDRRENFSHREREIHEQEQKHSCDVEVPTDVKDEQQDSCREEQDGKSKVSMLNESDEWREGELAGEWPVEKSASGVNMFTIEKVEREENQENFGEYRGTVEGMGMGNILRNEEEGLGADNGEEELEEEKGGWDLDSEGEEETVEGIQRDVVNKEENPVEGDVRVSMMKEVEAGSDKREEVQIEDAVVYGNGCDEEIKVNRMAREVSKTAEYRKGGMEREGDDNEEKEIIVEKCNVIAKEVGKSHTSEEMPEEKPESVLAVKLMDAAVGGEGDKGVLFDDDLREKIKEAHYVFPVSTLNGDGTMVQHRSDSEYLSNETEKREIGSEGVETKEEIPENGLESDIDKKRNEVKSKETVVAGCVTVEKEKSTYVDETHLEKKVIGKDTSQIETLTSKISPETKEEYRSSTVGQISDRREGYEMRNHLEREDAKLRAKECDDIVYEKKGEKDIKQSKEEWETSLDFVGIDESKRNGLQRKEIVNRIISIRAEIGRQSSEEAGLRLRGESSGHLSEKGLFDEVEKGVHVGGAVKNKIEQEEREKRNNARTGVKMENVGIKGEDGGFSEREVQRVVLGEPGTVIRVGTAGERGEGIGGKEDLGRVREEVETGRVETIEMARRELKVEKGITREGVEINAPRKREEKDSEMKVRESDVGVDRVHVEGSKEMHTDNTEGESRDESLSGTNEEVWEMDAGHAEKSVLGELKQAEGITDNEEIMEVLRTNEIVGKEDEIVEEMGKERKEEKRGIQGRDENAAIGKGFDVKDGMQGSGGFWKGCQGKVSKRMVEIQEGLEERRDRQRLANTSAEEVKREIERAWEDNVEEKADPRVRAKDEHPTNEENHAGEKNGSDTFQKFESKLRKTVVYEDNAKVEVGLVEKKVKARTHDIIDKGEEHMARGKEVAGRDEGEEHVSREGGINRMTLSWKSEQHQFDENLSQKEEATEKIDKSNERTLEKEEIKVGVENEKISDNVIKKEENSLGEGQVPNFAVESKGHGNILT